MMIRGVNLGGWLVLEKWMTPELFEGTDAIDEYHLLDALGDQKETIIKHHRETFITLDDFKWIKAHGINTVRLPLGHWTFTAPGPYIEAKAFVDLVFEWANEVGLDVVLDVHAAPGCQNGFDNGGLSGVCEWHKDDVNIKSTLMFIKELCQHYKDQPRLSGIQVLNEPRWDIPLDILESFYLDSYRLIRTHCSSDVTVIFHDAFRLDVWRPFFTTHSFENVILDTHMYQVFSHNDSKRHMHEVVEKVVSKRLHELSAVMPYVNVVVGEWSLGIHDYALKEVTNDVERNAFYRTVGNGLLMTFEKTSGWFFWSYKLSEEATKKRVGWSFKDVIEKQYICLI
jgi:glucan 1,3-beta-glucosidase